MSLIVAALLLVSLPGCGGDAPRQTIPMQPKPAPVADPALVHWGFEPHGVRVVLKADDTLNALGETPLALSLCVYQLKNREFFDNMAQTSEGIYTLLDCKVKDSGMVAAEHLFVQPGEEKIFTLDRAEEARFLAVVAGFNESLPQNAAKVTPMLIHENRTTYIPFVYTSKSYEAGIMDFFVSISAHALSLTGVERAQ